MSSESSFRGPKKRNSTERSLDRPTSRCKASASSARIRRMGTRVPSLNARDLSPFIGTGPPDNPPFLIYMRCAYRVVYRVLGRWQLRKLPKDSSRIQVKSLGFCSFLQAHPYLIV